jgi:hypothetical protein
MENFGEDLTRQRRERERHLAASIERLSDAPGRRESRPGIDEAQRRREADITASLLLPEYDEEEYEAGRSASEPPPPAEAGAEPEARPASVPPPQPAPADRTPEARSPGLLAAWLILVGAIVTAAALIYFTG